MTIQTTNMSCRSFHRRVILALTATVLAQCCELAGTLPAAAGGTSPGSGSSGAVFRLKGSDFSVSGAVVAFDGKKYLVDTVKFGAVEIDSARFDCAGAQCPTAPFAKNSAGAPGSAAANAVVAPVPAPASPAPATAGGRIDRRIVISGSELIGQRLMPGLIEAYAARTGARVTMGAASGLSAKYVLTPQGEGERVEIDVRSQGNDQGFQDLERSSAQLVMATRPIVTEEAARLATLGLGNFRLPSHEHVLALDGLMVFVAPRNPAVALSIESLAKILAGEITDWSQINLPAGKINVYASQTSIDGSDTLTTQLLAPRGLQLTGSAQRTANNAELAERVAADPNGIGLGGVAQRPSTKALTIGTSCGLIVKPSVFAVKTEEYPLSRALYLYTAGEPADPATRAFLTFVLSPAAQPTINQLDFIDQDVQTLTFADQTDRLAYALNAAPEDFDLMLARTMISELRTAQRLSLTLRFQSNSEQLSAKSLRDMNQLVGYLAAKDNLTKRALLVGFADSSGTFPTNLRLSERRTTAVYRTLLALAQGKIEPARLTARSYGKLSPVACNDSITHRTLNRRVEVWLQN